MDFDGPRLHRTHGLIRRRGLLAAGVTDEEVRARLRRGALLPVRPGAYVPAEDRPGSPEAWHAVAVRAAVPDLAPQVVVSHVSAAVLHRMTVWAVPLNRVHGTRARRSGSRRGAAVHLHAAALDPDEIILVEGIAVTTPARTLVDLARSVPFEQAVSLLDAALFAGSVSLAQLEEALRRAQGRPGTPAARRALAFADGRSESVGESRSRVAMDRAGLPVPDLQWEVPGPHGDKIGRVDFRWEEHGTIGEFDGRVKYGRLLRPGQDPGDAVFAEKVREDLIRDEHHRVVRWTWDDIAPFDGVADRLRRSFGRA